MPVVQIWSTEQKTVPLRQSKLEIGETLTAACYSRDGSCLALGSVHGTLLILDSARLAMLAILRDAHEKGVKKVCQSFPSVVGEPAKGTMGLCSAHT